MKDGLAAPEINSTTIDKSDTSAENLGHSLKKVLDYITIIVRGVEVVRFALILTTNIVLRLNGFFRRVSVGTLNSV